MSGPSRSDRGWDPFEAPPWLEESERKQERLRGLAEPEPARFGAAVTSSYTWLFHMAVLGYLMYLIGIDLGPGGPRYLATAFGLQSNGWLWFFIFLAWNVSLMPVSTAAVLYWDFTGRTYVGDRVGFAKSGGNDVSIWVGTISVLSTVALFTFVVPPGPTGWLGVVRAIAVLGVSLVLGTRITSYCVELLYRELYGPEYGPPPFRSRRLAGR